MASTSCVICSGSISNLALKCCECNLYVCLSFNNLNQSHISLHCNQQRHFEYKLYFQRELQRFNIECSICRLSNILNLHYILRDDRLYISCSQCISHDYGNTESMNYDSILLSHFSLQRFVSSYLLQFNYQNFSRYTQHFMELENRDYELHKLKSDCYFKVVVRIYRGVRSVSVYCFYSNQLLSIGSGDTIIFKFNQTEIKGYIETYKKIDGNKYIYLFKTDRTLNDKDIIEIIKSYSSITHDRRMTALSWFESSRGENDLLKKMICNPSEYANNLQLRSPVINRNRNLNDSQRVAVENAVKNRLSLITGPPGTGKTRIICEIVRILKINYPNIKILVSSDSNIAIYNAVKALKNSRIKVLRHISGEKYYEEKDTGNSELNDVTFSSLFEEYIENSAPTDIRRAYYNELEIDSKIIEEYKKILRDMFNMYLSKVDVLCCTSTLSGNKFISNTQFDVLIIDEASQMTEPSLLIPLNLGCEQLILLGDNKQLSPYVEDERELKEYRISMFKRLSPIFPPSFLNLQYRSHPEIASVYSELFYENRINSDATTSRNIIPSINDLFPVEGIPIIYIYHDELEMAQFYSFYNEKEIEITGKILKKLCNRGIDYNQIGIVTPYKQHKIKMMEYLNDIDLLDRNDFLEINVIDSYQGCEKDIIIINCVRSNSSHRIGFVKSKKRINVVLSRAKCALIIIGNPNCLNIKIWKNINEIMSRKNVFVDSDDIVSDSSSEEEDYSDDNIENSLEDNYQETISDYRNPLIPVLQNPTIRTENNNIQNERQNILNNRNLNNLPPVTNVSVAQSRDNIISIQNPPITQYESQLATRSTESSPEHRSNTSIIGFLQEWVLAIVNALRMFITN